MKKSKLQLIIFFLFVSLIISGCQKRIANQENNNTEADLKSLPGQIEKKVNQTDAKISAPSQLLQCDSKYYTERNKSGVAYDCSHYEKGEVCSYYKKIKNGQEAVHNLEYLTACHACRFYGKEGRTKIGNDEFVHLGYENKKCSQGMYKQK